MAWYHFKFVNGQGQEIKATWNHPGMVYFDSKNYISSGKLRVSARNFTVNKAHPLYRQAGICTHPLPHMTQSMPVAIQHAVAIVMIDFTPGGLMFKNPSLNATVQECQKITEPVATLLTPQEFLGLIPNRVSGSSKPNTTAIMVLNKNGSMSNLHYFVGS